MASPLVGYNTNVRHHGKVYHIQTEDSGLTHGHIFTHLFADGGRIIATKKTTYSQYVGTERYPSVVKKLMQAQHKAMFIALRDGLFDQDEVRGAKEFAAREIVLDDERGDAQPASSPGMVVAPSSPGTVAAVAPAAPSPAARAPAPTPAVASRTEIDVDALERAAAGYTEPSAADVLVDRGPTVPGSVPAPIPPAAEVARPPIARTFAKPAAPPAAPPAPVPAPPPATGKSKYGTTQSAVKRTSSRPRESLFGSDLLSEKSLDEVIMSYLAEDLDTKE
jgi:hypothetical protein